MTDHERFDTDLAPFLLGALEPEEERALEVHLAACPHCQAELDRLRLAADALPRSVPQVTPPASLKASLMEIVEREAAGDAGQARPRVPLRKRLAPTLSRIRPATAWASAAFLLAVGIATGIGLSELGGSDDARVVTAQVDEGRAPSASASLVVPGEGRDGAILRVNGLPSLPPDRVYQVWVRRDGEVVPGPLFSVGEDGHGGTAVTDDVEDADEVMVTREARGGAPAPTEAPLLTVSL